MDINLNKILVPTDFSEVAESAAIHAATIAQKSGDEVWLLHVINKETMATLKKQKEGVEHLLEKITNLCKEYTDKYKVPFHFKLKEGSIFTTIGEVATEIDAKVMVLGTHGVVGMQKIVGAYALKVVASSKIPVIIVQERLPIGGNYLKIVSPIDGSVETKQKTLQTISIAKIFGAKVFLYRQKGFDDYLDDLISLNEKFVVRYLNEHNVAHEVVKQEKVSKNFAKDFIGYSKSIQADLIIILTTAEKGIKDIIIGPEEQMVINNEEQIPVMCVNPLQNIYRSERLSSAVNLSF
jgi:nucleotide-binding universal stress UspA family protein